MTAWDPLRVDLEGGRFGRKLSEEFTSLIPNVPSKGLGL